VACNCGKNKRSAPARQPRTIAYEVYGGSDGSPTVFKTPKEAETHAATVGGKVRSTVRG
jgi:hypothetical protein